MYSDGLANGIWDEVPDVYVPGSILAYWELCIAAGLQIEYGNEAPDVYVPGSILAYWELCLVAGLQMEHGKRSWNAQTLPIIPRQVSLRKPTPRRRPQKGFRNGQFDIPSHSLFSYSICKSVSILWENFP